MNANSIPKSFGFIGGGRVTFILLEGFRRANSMPSSITISDPKQEALEKLRSRHSDVHFAQNDNRQAATQDIVFLAVHPPLIPEVLAEIKDSLKPDALLMSLAPRFTLTRLSELLGGFDHLVRMIPNAPSIIGAGYNPLSFASGVTPGQRRELLGWLECLGQCPEVEETKLEGYALLTAMGPTYLWFQLQTLRELASRFGLSDGEIPPAVQGMLLGSGKTLFESGLFLEEITDLIPVKPLAEDEPMIKQAYETRLSDLFAKIKP